MIRGVVPLRIECAPAFNYARDSHTTSIISDDSAPGVQTKVLFESKSLSLDLRFVAESSSETNVVPEVDLKLLDLQEKGHLGLGAYCELNLLDGQCVTFVLRVPPEVKASYKSHPKPSLEQATELGVPLDRL